MRQAVTMTNTMTMMRSSKVLTTPFVVFLLLVTSTVMASSSLSSSSSSLSSLFPTHQQQQQQQQRRHQRLDLSYLHRTSPKHLAAAIRQTLRQRQQQQQQQQQEAIIVANDNNDDADGDGDGAKKTRSVTTLQYEIDLTASLIGKDTSEVLSSLLLSCMGAGEEMVEVDVEPTTISSSDAEATAAEPTIMTTKTTTTTTTTTPTPPPNTTTALQLHLIARRNQWTPRDIVVLLEALFPHDDTMKESEPSKKEKEKEEVEESRKGATKNDVKTDNDTTMMMMTTTTTTTTMMVEEKDDDTKNVTLTTATASTNSTNIATNTGDGDKDKNKNKTTTVFFPHPPAFATRIETLDLGWNTLGTVSSSSSTSSATNAGGGGGGGGGGDTSSTSTTRGGSTSSIQRHNNRNQQKALKAMDQALQRILQQTNDRGGTGPTTIRLDVCGLGPSTCRAMAKGIVNRFTTVSSGSRRGTRFGHDDQSQENGNDDKQQPMPPPPFPPPLSLHLACNQRIGDSGVTALAAAVRTVASRQRKEQQNEASDESKDSGADDEDSVGGFVVLDVLDLSGCGIGDVGAKALAIALERNPLCIRHLDLSNNLITNEGAASLARALEDGGRIETLDVSHNKDLGDRGAKDLARAIETGCIKNLYLRSCTLHADGAACFGRTLRSLALTNNAKVKSVSIDLSGNPLGLLRKKPKSGNRFSATALRSKATATTASYMNLIGKTVQKGLKDFGLDASPDTLESDDEEESKMEVDDDEESTTKCGGLAFAEAFIEGNEEEELQSRVSSQNRKGLHVSMGLRHCSFDTRAAEALAAVVQEARGDLGIDLELDVTMNNVLEEDVINALHGKKGYESLLSDMAENYLEALEVLREARERTAEAAGLAAARMAADAELDSAFGPSIAIRSRRDYGWDHDAEDTPDDEWDSDADYEYAEEDDEDCY